MGLYYSYATNIHCRNTKYIFSFFDNKCFLLNKNRKQTPLFEANNSFSLYQKLTLFTESKKLDSYEIVLTKNNNLEELIKFLSDYLLDKDVSVGLIYLDVDSLDKNSTLLESFGVTKTNSFAPNNRFFDLKADMMVGCALPKAKKDDSATYGMLHYEPSSSKKTTTKKIQLDESFHEKFLKLLIESSRDNAYIYKKAGVSKQVFSKILSGTIPTKLTLVSLCIGLELPLRTARELIDSAGYSLTKSMLFDAIIIRFMSNGIYDYDLINSELNEYGCPLLGWHPRED